MVLGHRNWSSYPSRMRELVIVPEPLMVFDSSSVCHFENGLLRPCHIVRSMAAHLTDFLNVAESWTLTLFYFVRFRYGDPPGREVHGAFDPDCYENVPCDHGHVHADVHAHGYILHLHLPTLLPCVYDRSSQHGRAYSDVKTSTRFECQQTLQ